MKALYIVASPLQMLYAIEARHEFSITGSQLLILDTGIENDQKQIAELVSQLAWDKTYKMSWPVKSRKLLKILKQIMMAFYLNMSQTKYDYLFLGDFALFMASLVRRHKLYIISDGNKIIWQKDMYGELYQLNNLTRFHCINQLVVKLLPSYFGRSIPLNYFTPFEFDEDGDNYCVNSFSWLKKGIELDRFEDAPADVVYFLGAYLSEGVWTKYVNENYFFLCVERIFLYYKSQNKRIVYIPHRLESEEKLGRMTALFPEISVQYIERGVELEFVTKKLYPLHVASFSSTALYTIGKIFSKCSCDAFALDNDEFLPKQFIPHFDSIYKYYEKHMNVDRNLLLNGKGGELAEK